MHIINPYRFGSAPSANLLLDETGLGSAHAAYSVARKLRSAYSGSAIRVRRSSDNAEQDIGFSGDVLDESSLTTFVGANDGFVVTLYDQSGNSNAATQATTTKQAKIVSSGTVVTSGGFPALSVDGTDEYVFSGAAASSSVATLLAVCKTDSTAGADNTYLKIVLSVGTDTVDRQVFLQYGRHNQSAQENKPSMTLHNRTVLNSTTANTNQLMMIGVMNGTDMGLYVNSAAEVSTTAAGTLNITNGTINVLRGADASAYHMTAQYWLEGVVWLADLDAYAATIKSNVNGFYSIY